MRAYLVVSGSVFGLMLLVHAWRFVVEGARLATEPDFIVTTLLAAGLCGWALRLLVGRR
jgi:hypothetical protein